jgi:16S rRNA (adenine1518-N6/adenine1519-N6)-dimethyltransferase
MKHLRPIKDLGQSFLTHAATADELVAALGVGPADHVLEIGAGKGVLTDRLAAVAGRVVAVEIDPRLADLLGQELAGCGNLDIVRQDFMEFDLSRYRGLKVIGNLPYNLSSQMLLRLLDSTTAWDRAVLTTQREFAQRVLGIPGTKANGALTVFVDILCEKRRLFNIRPECFKPRPDVVSTSFLLTRRSEPLFRVPDQESFRRVVRGCFVQRRKTIANNLRAGLGLDREDALRALTAAGIAPGLRAEALRPEQFRDLALALVRPTRQAGLRP